MPSATGAGVSNFSIARPIVTFMSAINTGHSVLSDDLNFHFRRQRTGQWESVNRQFPDMHLDHKQKSDHDDHPAH
jgi:hypothetical protein